MAKKNKNSHAKYVKMGADLQIARRNSVIALIAAVLVGVALWVYVSFSGVNDHTVVTSVVIFGATVVLVFGIGILGNKFAGYNTELNKLKNEYGVTKEEIKTWRANH